MNLRQWMTWIGRNGKRIGVTVIGFALLLAGLVMLVFPGPGILVVLAGLAVLGSEYAWARRALAEAKKKAGEAKQRAMRFRRRKRH